MPHKVRFISVAIIIRVLYLIFEQSSSQYKQSQLCYFPDPPSSVSSPDEIDMEYVSIQMYVMYGDTLLTCFLSPPRTYAHQENHIVHGLYVLSWSPLRLFPSLVCTSQ